MSPFFVWALNTQIISESACIDADGSLAFPGRRARDTNHRVLDPLCLDGAAPLTRLRATFPTTRAGPRCTSCIEGCKKRKGPDNSGLPDRGTAWAADLPPCGLADPVPAGPGYFFFSP